VSWLLIAVLVWGIPLWLVSIACWRYGRIGSTTKRDLVLLRVAMFSLLLSEGILLLLGVVAVSNTPTPRVGPQTLGLVSVLLCAASLLTLLAAKRNADTVRAWKAIASANIYLILLWPLLMLVH
jgi:hypothetical protein